MLFPELLVSGSRLHLCGATVHGDFWMYFFYFPREKWTPTTFCSSHFEIWNYFNEQHLAVTVCVSPRCFWKNSAYFYRVGCPGFPAQFALENPHIISTCSHMAVGGNFQAALTHFSRSSRSSGVERHFSEPSMVKSSSPSRVLAQFILSVC